MFGEVTMVFHAVVDAERGIVYPAVTVGVYVSVDPAPVIVRPIPEIGRAHV